MDGIINSLLNGNSPVYIILAYLIYKDWKNTEIVTKALTRIDIQLDKVCKQLSKRGDNT